MEKKKLFLLNLLLKIIDLMICDTEYCVRSDNVLCSSTEKIRKLFIFIKNDKIDDLIEDLP